MYLDQFANEAPHLYAGGEVPPPVLLESAPGIGKSFTIENVLPRKLVNAGLMEQCPVLTFNLAMMDAPDLNGFLFPGKDEDGVATSRFTRSPIAQAILDTKSPTGIAFFDERSQAEHINQKAFANFAEARRLGSFVLPDGWWIVSAGNRMEDRSGVVRPLMHLRNREAVIQIKPHAPGFIRWAETVGELHPMAVGFARFKPGAIQVDCVPADTSPFPSYRSFTKAAKYLGNKAGRDSSGRLNMELPWDKSSQQVVAGFVGDALAAEWMAFCKVHAELPTFDQIVANPDGAKVPKDDRLDAQFAAVSMAVHSADPSNADKVFTYIMRLRKELQTSAAVSLLGKGGGALLNSPSIAKWVTENRALITASMS